MKKNKISKSDKLLDKKEEYKLIKEWQSNKNTKSLNRLLSAYKKLVVSFSKKFSGFGLSQEDLIQEGTMGLMYAIEKFDISKGFRLSTYSHWWIRAMMQDYIIKNWSIVKNGTTASQKLLFFSFNKIKKIVNFDSLKTMDINQVKKISNMLNIKPLDIENLDSKLKMGDQSLNEKINVFDSKVELIDILKDSSDNQENVIQNKYDNKFKQNCISLAINKLNKREKFIINSRKISETPKTLHEIGNILKISKERVRQIEVISLKKLKKNILDISKESKEFFIN